MPGSIGNGYCDAGNNNIFNNEVSTPLPPLTPPLSCLQPCHILTFTHVILFDVYLISHYSISDSFYSFRDVITMGEIVVHKPVSVRPPIVVVVEDTIVKIRVMEDPLYALPLNPSVLPTTPYNLLFLKRIYSLLQ